MKTRGSIHLFIASSLVLLSSCISQIAEKDSTATLAKQVAGGLLTAGPGQSKGRPVVVTVPAGAEVGVVQLSNFQSAPGRFAEALGVDPTRGQLGAFARAGLSSNLPEVGSAREVDDGTLFALTKLVSGACTDRLNLDRDSTTNEGRIVGGLRLGEASDSASNSPMNWDAYYNVLAERLLGRMKVTPEEKAVLDDLRAKVAAASSKNATSVALAVCIAVGSSMDSLTF